MESGNLGKELFSGAFWSILDNLFKQVITFVVFILLARVLNPETFGLLAVPLLIVQIFSTVIFDSIATALIRKADIADDDYSTGFWLCLGLSVPAFALLLASAELIEHWIGTRGLAEVMRGTSVMILVGGLSRMHEVWLTKRMNFKSLAIRSSVSTAVGGSIGLYLAFKGYGITSLVSQQVVTSLLQLVLLWILSPWRPKLIISKPALFEIIHYGKHVALTGITNAANQNSDIFFVTYYLGPVATGIYTTGKRISNTLNQVISTALLRVSLPAFSRIQNDEYRFKEAYLNSVAFTAMATAPLFIGLAVLSKDITLVLLDEKWLPAVPVMQIVTIVGFLTSIGYYNQSVMLVRNKPQWQTRLTLIYAVTNLIAFFIFTRFGVVYTALAFSLRALLLFPISVGCAITLLSIPWKKYINAIYPALVASLLMAIVLLGCSSMLSNSAPVLRLALLVVIGLASYGIFILFLLPVHKRTQLFHLLGLSAS